MREVSDAFLLNIAEVSATLIGLFVVGVFFYASGEHRRLEAVEAVESYFRSGTRIVLVLFAIPLGLSLTLVALEPIWTSVLFVPLSLALEQGGLHMGDSSGVGRGVPQHDHGGAVRLRHPQARVRRPDRGRGVTAPVERAGERAP